jgi:hypothetical protein
MATFLFLRLALMCVMRLKMIIVISLLVLSVTIFSRCFRQDALAADPRGSLYADASTCITCHKDIADSSMHAAHYRTSSLANTDSLKRLINPSMADFYFGDSSYIRLRRNESTFQQTHFTGNQQLNTQTFDIAFGSGEKAQTYAYWNGDKLYELPLTYFTGINGWANSPGFPSGHPRFDRIIESRCFQCHASYIEREITQTGSLNVEEKLNKNTVLFGIDCQRCHGPAKEHVDFHTDNPSEKKAMHITAISSLSRQRQLDLCGTCHSGNDQAPQRNLFGFKPGDTLSNYYYPEFGSTREPDVHGKQLQLLQSSQCFQQSTMTCSTCHNSHGSGNGQLQAFITKCMNCHQQSTHATTMLNNKTMTLNCIDCHMPKQPSKDIYFNNGAERKIIPYLLTTHKIGVYGQK